MQANDSVKNQRSGPWVEIDLNALCENFELLDNAAPQARTFPVVKCNAYGLGAVEISSTLAKRFGCNAFFVAYAEEGMALRTGLSRIAPEAEIYVFNGPDNHTVSFFADANLTPVINHSEQARLWASKFAGKPVALHVDTGMNRLGAPIKQLDEIAKIDGLNVQLFMSHLACGATIGHEMNERQRETFIDAASLLPQCPKSLSASAGILLGEKFQFDVTRPGISLYGGSPFDDDDARIKPVAALRTRIVQIRDIKAGESVGYGATRIFQSSARLATVSLGYGDGFPRAGSRERAKAFVNDEFAPVVGQISMDLISIDISHLRKPAKVGDIVEFFGPSLSLHQAGANFSAGPYELLTGLGARVDRRYF